MLGGIGAQTSSQISTCSVKSGMSVGAEQQVVAERDGRAVDLDLRAEQVARGAELALLVELAVLRQVALGHGAEDPAAVDHDRGVEQALLGAQRRADDRHRRELLAGGADLLDRLERGVEQRVLAEEVVGCVGGQPELREHDQRRVLFVGLPARARSCARR